jgi:hypothetical protein
MDFLDARIFTENLVEQAGQISIREFVNYPFFYLLSEGSPEDLPNITPKYHTRLNQFLNFLWFAKDNSVTIGSMFCFLPNTKYLMQNIKLATYSNSEGNHSEILVTKKDFEIALKAFEQFTRLSNEEDNVLVPKAKFEERPVVTDSSYHYADYNKNTRIERALSFLTMARANSFLPLKIALCMSLLECLFTTDRQEVTHKVCERVSLYIGGSYEDKVQNYKIIKDAYDVRSGFFHGQDIDKKQDTRLQLAIHSQKVDSILRTILTKVLFDDFAIFNGSKDARVDFFSRMVLG